MGGLKVWLAVAACLLGMQALRAQYVFRAVVVDSKGVPVSYANAGFNGTSLFAVTDGQGRFELPVERKINTEFVLIHLGYDIYMIDDPYGNWKDTIRLQERLVNIDNVVVTPNPFPREVLMPLLRTALLGKTEAGRACKIKNEDAIKFSYEPDGKIIRARADVPLVIDNGYLEYDLLFSMADCMIAMEWGVTNMPYALYSSYSGYVAFTDRKPRSSKYRNRRDRVYDSSMQRLLKIMFYGTPEETGRLFYGEREDVPGLLYNAETTPGFFVMSGRNRRVTSLDDLSFSVTDTLSMKKLVIDRPRENRTVNEFTVPSYQLIKVAHKYYSNVSSIVFLANEYLIDSYGNVSPATGMLTTGDVAARKLGDTLPLDYRME